jgi:dTDP-4-dehydrorhamnose 3,5-epimerase
VHTPSLCSSIAPISYKTTDYYALEHERTIAWNDPDLAIDWWIDGEPSLSQKDRAGMQLRDAEVYA